MPLTISDFMERLRQKRAAPEFIPLVTITFQTDAFGPAPGTRVIRLSDRTRYLPLSGGAIREFLGLLAGGSEVGHDVDLIDPSRSPAVADLVLDNARPVHEFTRFTEMVRHAANVESGTVDVFAAAVTIGYMFEGGTLGIDDVTIFTGPADRLTGASGDGREVTLRVGSDEGTAEAIIVDRDPTGCAGGLPGAYRLSFHSSTPDAPADFEDLSGAITANELKVNEAYSIVHREESGLSEESQAYYLGLSTYPWVHRFRFYSDPGNLLPGGEDYAVNLSCDAPPDTSLEETLDILELAPPATLEELQGYSFNSPPVVVRTIASVTFPANPVSSDCSYALPSPTLVEVDMTGVVFWMLRVRNWNIPPVVAPQTIDHDIRVDMWID